MEDIDEYEEFLSAIVAGWPAKRRAAFAVAMVERWLPSYERFSAIAGWGDTANLRRILDALWGHVLGRSLSPAARAQYAEQLRSSTPNRDDFDDAEPASATCRILSDALETCDDNQSAVMGVRAALSGFEAALRNWTFAVDDQHQLWRSLAAQKEYHKQTRLIEYIDAITTFDEATVAALRKSLTTAEFVGEPSGTAATITNQVAFAKYRAKITLDLKKAPWDAAAGLPFGQVMKFTTPWMGRYRRRKDVLTGRYGKMADVLGLQALLARNRAHDITPYAGPLWDPAMRQYIENLFQPQFNDLDAESLHDPHRYGPSLRRLWVEGKNLGQSDQEACARINQWVQHVPAAWAIEDQREKDGLTHANPALNEPLARRLNWDRSNSADYPWEIQFEGRKWRVRINDFPDDYMYTLMIGDTEVGPFHDWPAGWRRC